jgi:predicted Zn-dependent protease
MYLGLRMSLNSAKRFADAIPVLETGEKMAPDSPTGHYQLAFAYTGTGRRDDANREAALQRQTAEALEAVKRKALVLEKLPTWQRFNPMAALTVLPLIA